MLLRSHPRRLAPVIGTTAAILAVAALTAAIGADTRWLAALGHVIAARRSIPAGVPFAAASTSHWANPLALAELVLYAVNRLGGDRGLMGLQLLAVGLGYCALARDGLRGGAPTRGVCIVLVLVAIGALPALAIVRLQLFSLILFPVLVALLRAQTRAPSRGIWWAVPLLALWSNLHGAAVLGLGVLVCYLMLVRVRSEPLTAVLVAVGAAAALCATPALLATFGYYHGLLTNLAAQRGTGLWSSVSLGDPLDLLLVGSALAMAAQWRRASPAFWELAIAGGLAVLTLHAARNGVWLLMFMAPVAARGVRARHRRRRRDAPGLARFAPAFATVGVLLASVALARGPFSGGASQALVGRAVSLANGSPVLASGPLAEQVALKGGEVWISDPLDAFSVADQAAYLDWLDGARSGLAAVTPSVRIVLVSRDSRSAKLMASLPGFVPVGGDPQATLYARVPRPRY